MDNHGCNNLHSYLCMQVHLEKGTATIGMSNFIDKVRAACGKHICCLQEINQRRNNDVLSKEIPSCYFDHIIFYAWGLQKQHKKMS